MTKQDYWKAIALLEQAANAMHNDLSGDERKILGDRLFGLADDLRRFLNAGLFGPRDMRAWLGEK